MWEMLRADPANHILGLRLNLWVALIVFIGSVTYLVLSARRRPGREKPEEIAAVDPPRHREDPPVEVPAEA